MLEREEELELLDVERRETVEWPDSQPESQELPELR